MSVTVYIAGPISLGGTCSPEEIAAYVNVFHREAVRLRAEGVTVLSPVELPTQASWEDYMKLTLPMVCAADKVIVLPEWEKSRGALLEAFLANQLGIPVVEASGVY